MYKHYDTDINNVNDCLSRDGIAVIPNILKPSELEDVINKKWETLQHMSKGNIKREEPDSWKGIYQFFPLHNMLIQHFYIGHSQFVWDVRQNKAVHNVFSKIWKDDDLLVSFDGVSIHMPHEVTNRGFYKQDSWLHTDQSYMRNGYECIQGMVTLYDVEEGDATLKILEGSHSYHGDYAKYRLDNGMECSPDNWHKLDEDGINFYKQRGCNEHNALAKAGSLILWDSRTIHQGVEPLKKRANPKHRTVIYVCMTPRSRAQVSQLRKKQKAFNEMRMTSHWPHHIILFQKDPWTYGREIPDYNKPFPPILDKHGLRLAGF